MNERIRELAEQAGCDWWEGRAQRDMTRCDTELQKFAELIVKECAGIADGLSKLYPRTDVGFDVGYTMGTTRATKEIKEHFGVEE
jgi:hypothetical protein